MRRLIELSHRITEGMVTYPGVPTPRLGVHLSREDSREVYAPGTEFHIGSIELVANTGTYLDTPHHRYPDGPDLAGVPLEAIADLPGLVVRAEGLPSVGPERFAGLDVRGRAVLVHTGWDRHFGTEEYFHGHPYLEPDAARWLAEQGAALVGIDSLNIDDTPPRGERPAHTVLLGAGIPIVEHMTGLAALPDEGFRFHAAPPMVAGMGTFPVRAYAVVGG
ncbi:kynurenine formamidase [Streptosporangium becharense]|uniref:Kynurenine formamidase n=1 Tax=Streptosporangium becharense TaxID=1816182 RepID=A0A7W9IEB4_9ACTN|nr:cyclase family protein [Streptosporangium becharense]MBB2911966.1 kynurenine formamidase [Streptosporangium becharense]MBB5818513.1 kynurenine formamidase [Streptosporangium becharense]